MSLLKLPTITLLILGFSNLQAQETITTSGGESYGSGGTASYTIGQVVSTTNIGTNGYSVAQGVQQPYEISVLLDIYKSEKISLELLAYPNPATDFLNLRINNYEISSLTYQIFDINGKLLKSEKITKNVMQINMKTLAPATYFIKVSNNKKAVKTFKIIKK